MPPQWKTYRLVKLTGWTLAQIEAASAVECDWLLAIDDMVHKIKGQGDPNA